MLTWAIQISHDEFCFWADLVGVDIRLTTSCDQQKLLDLNQQSYVPQGGGRTQFGGVEVMGTPGLVPLVPLESLCR